MSVISKQYRKSSGLTLARFDQTMWAPILLGILFFFILSLGAPDSIERLVLFGAVFMLIVVAVRFKVLRDRIHLPFLALTLYVIMDGISTFYAVSGKFALREFMKVFLAFMLAVILLATSPKKEAQRGKRIATILAVCTGIGSLVGIDMYSTGWISGAVVWVLSRFTEVYADCSGVQTLSRMASIFDNANVYAGFSGLGVMLSLGLADAAEQKKERCLYLVLLFLNALTFILTISLGAFFFGFIALIVYLLIQKRENRVRTIVLMLEVLVFAGAAAVVVYKISGRADGGMKALSLVCTALCAAAFCVADEFAGRKILEQLAYKGNTSTIIGMIVILLVVSYVASALIVTGPITLGPGESMERVLFLKPGAYSMTIRMNGGLSEIKVMSRTRTNALVTLCSANESNVSIVVPEDSVAVHVFVSSSEGAHITSADFGDNKVPLKYMLLPDFIVQRLTNRNASESVIQRLVYFQDGLKLFRRSPIVGLGIGAFENAIKSVQSYYYETKYAHNHYFQTMLETGIVGLFLFLFLLISSAIAIWKSRKEQTFAPMLAALWMFMAGQAIHDIVFSAYTYLPLAYGSFALINLCCGEAIQKPKLSKVVRSVLIGVFSVCTAIYCIFIAGNLMAKRNIEREPSMQMLVQCVNIDRFEWADYALPYVNNAIGEDGKEVSLAIRQQADVFAERLSQVNSNTIPIYLAEYYFKTERPEKAIAMLEKYVTYIASDVRGWETSFNVLRGYDDGSETIRDGVIKLAGMLDSWNAENWGTITLSEENQAYIASRR